MKQNRLVKRSGEGENCVSVKGNHCLFINLLFSIPYLETTNLTKKKKVSTPPHINTMFCSFI